MNDPRSQVDRAQQASMVLENDAFRTAMGQLKADVIERWKACPIRDREGQLLLLQLAKLTDKFEGLLVGMIETGKLAQHQLNLDKERNESGIKKAMRRVL
jgi:hypothetical protein